MTTKLNSQPTYTDLLVNDVPAARFTEQGIAFDNTGTGLTATNVQDAVSELDSGKLDTANAFGVGQTWQDVKASRVLGVTYTNSTGAPIEVSVAAYASGSHSIRATLSDGSTSTELIANGTNNLDATLGFTVPPDWDYSVINTGTSPVLDGWVELRKTP